MAVSLSHVIGFVLREGHTPAELELIRPIAHAYKAAHDTSGGTVAAAVTKPLLDRLISVVGKDRVWAAVRQVLTATAAAAPRPQQAALPMAGPAQVLGAPGAPVLQHAVPASLPSQSYPLDGGAAQPGAKRARVDSAGVAAMGTLAVIAAPRDDGLEAAAAVVGDKRGRRSSVEPGGADGSLVADVNLEDEQAQLLAPRTRVMAGTRSHVSAAHAAAPAPALGGVTGATGGGEHVLPRPAPHLASWLGSALQAEGLRPGARGAEISGAVGAQLTELIELLDGGLRQHMRQLLCGMCDASQRRRETAAAQAGLVRSDAPAGGVASALAVTAASGGPPDGASSVRLKERVQLKDALYHLETERRTSKSPLLVWWRAVGSVRNRFPRTPARWRGGAEPEAQTAGAPAAASAPAAAGL